MDRIFRSTKIQAIATALPKEIFNLQELAATFGEETVAKIMKATKIKSIHLAPESMTASDYCEAAARKLFTAGIARPEEIDAVIFVTETPDYLLPHTSASLQARLNLPNRALTFDINYGCAGYVYGLFQAHLLIETGYCEKVLLCAGDLPTRYIHPLDKSSRLVFGDGGSATILTAEKNMAPVAFSFHTEGEKIDQLVVRAGAFRMPKKSGVTDVISYDDQGNGTSLEKLHMDGIGVMNFIMRSVKVVAAEVLKILGLEISAIDICAFHQPNALVLKYLAKKLGVAEDKIPFGAENTGNTTCASIPLLLATLFPGVNENFGRVLVSGFGTGLSCAAGVVDLSATEIFETIQI